MPSEKPPRSQTPPKNTRAKSEPIASPTDSQAFVQKKGSKNRKAKQFESDLAMDIIGELYPLLLENCTDQDDEVDTQALFETLAGLVGLFIADYAEGFGHEKALEAFQNLIDLSLNTYQERSGHAIES